MEREDDFCIWSGNWWIEGDKAWLISLEYNILFCVDLILRSCEFVTEIPFSAKKFRSTPRCIKYGKDIFCVPDKEPCVWIYNLDNCQFSQLRIDNPQNIRLSIIFFWLYGSRIYAVSEGLKQIIEIDAKNKKVEKYFPYDVEERTTPRILSEKNIYSVYSALNQVRKFNIVTKSTETYSLPDIGGKLHTVCFDGKRYWLSGYNRALYVWDKQNNSMQILEGFPEDFGIYNSDKNEKSILDCESKKYLLPVFVGSVVLGEYVWFIPYVANKILYVNKNTYEIKALEIEDEVETKESILSREMSEGKYVLEYIRENRYIGLFSFKNQHLFEIDTERTEVIKNKFHFSEQCLKNAEDIFNKRIILHEKGETFLKNVFFQNILKEGLANIEREGDKTGASIYRKTKMDMKGECR